MFLFVQVTDQGFRYTTFIIWHSFWWNILVFLNLTQVYEIFYNIILYIYHLFKHVLHSKNTMFNSNVKSFRKYVCKVFKKKCWNFFLTYNRFLSMNKLLIFFFLQRCQTSTAQSHWCFHSPSNISQPRLQQLRLQLQQQLQLPQQLQQLQHLQQRPLQQLLLQSYSGWISEQHQIKKK